MSSVAPNLPALSPRLFCRARGGLTLVECLLALTILAGAFLAAVSTASVGHRHLREGDIEFQAVRLARDLLEEIISKSYSDPNGVDVFGPETGELTRADFDDVNDYHTFSEAAGQVRDLIGSLYPPAQQSFARSVSVSAGTTSIPALPATVNGVTVTITVTHSKGRSWQFSRFIAEPLN